jgi:hypothetical protein
MADQTNKADGGKNNPALLFEDMGFALYAVNRVLDYGAEKYERAGWKKVEQYRYRSAKDRHKTALEVFHERYDVESGMLHRAHEACNVLFLLQLEIEDMYTEYRAGSPDPMRIEDFVRTVFGTYNPPPQTHKARRRRKKYGEKISA